MTEIDVYKGQPSAFWTFSLAVYGRAGVPPACLTLQDSSGVDVNILLFSLFLGRSGRALSATDIGAIVATVEPWRHDIVAVLRMARRALKEPPAPFEGPAIVLLRKNVKAAELEAERIQQEALCVNFPWDRAGQAEPDTARACAGNIEAYRAHLGTTFDEQAAGVLLAAAAATEIKGVSK